MKNARIALLLGAAFGVAACSGTPPPGSTPFSTGGGSEVYSGALEIQSSEFAGAGNSVRSAYELFEDTNQLSTDTVLLSTATYSGEFVSRIGTDETFIDGSMNVDLDFTRGTGSGTLTNLEITGADTLNRRLSNTGSFTVDVPSLSSTGFTGTVSGSVSDDPAQVTSAVDTYTMSGTLDGTFVSDSSQDAMVGVMGGTISSTGFGTQPLDGVFAGQQ